MSYRPRHRVGQSERSLPAVAGNDLEFVKKRAEVYAKAARPQCN